MTRKTTLILAAAGALLAFALARHPRRAATVATGPASVRSQIDFGAGTFSAALSQTRLLAGSPGELFLSLDLAAKPAASGDRAPLDLALVIDHSGSMGGEKLEHARAAAQGILERLATTDRAALVQYDDTAQVLVPLVAMDEAGKARLRAAVQALAIGGGTNLHDGLVLGRDEVAREPSPGRLPRIVLLTDGLANEGITDPSALAHVAAGAAERGVHTSTVGLGLDYNENLMETLAESGRGQYYYVRDAASLETVFASELKNLQATVATGAQLRLEPAPGVEVAEVYGYPSTRQGSAVLVSLADLFGGDHRKVLVRLRAPAVREGTLPLLAAQLAFEDPHGGPRKQARLDISVGITADAQAALASADPTVGGQVVRVQSAQTLRRAAEAYEHGDAQAANGILFEQLKRNQTPAARKGLAAVGGEDLDALLNEAIGGMGAAPPSSPTGNALIKEEKAASRSLSR